MEENVAGALTYFLGFITGIFFLLTEPKNRFVRFHAMQPTILFGGLLVISLVLGIIPVINVLWLVISPLVGIAAFVLWVWLMYQAYEGKEYELPYVSQLSREQLKAREKMEEKEE
ncbi:MAG TPA: hypothetical protein ENI09_00745 [candidate division WWE3 bacterium]|uniref:DUF4870 domain-containing protein n=1 Tax=candidate division WWE3 bacterium TaxID=2053526 RepID=A0A7C1P023_UNCKA|nr:hypothetical protein [candidate division WWE3 bacterium]